MIIQDTAYLDDSHVVVDQDEYREIIQYRNRIIREASSYVQTYINHKSGAKPLGSKAYDRLYLFSTLKYFENILLKLPT